MSDLPGVRASNGGSRSAGPVPVTGQPSAMRTPREVMRDRHAREARRQEEEGQKAEEQRRLAEERRISAERRVAAVAGAGAPRLSGASSAYTPDIGAQQGSFDGGAGERRSRTAVGVAGTDVLGQPVGRTTQDYTSNRTRTTSVDLSRQAQATTGGARRTQQSQSAPRQPSASSVGAASSPQAPQAQQPTQPAAAASSAATNSSSFPHAFQRWENLSAHWEGLTSYWLHKLEQNTEEIRTAVPNASTLNRQITDLSAAGANLFHAVVELQRLRASSERKFQRWFFETRADTERNQEVQAQMERQLRLERSAKEEAAQKRAEAEEAATAARREVVEMRRELTISKDEARRAWEELGRSNQESLETAQSLKEGRVTIVAGLQVVPYFGGPSRTDSASQRPVTRDDGQGYYVNAASGASAVAAGGASAGNEMDYYREAASPTNTDPFTEVASRQPSKPTAPPTSYQPPLPAATARVSPPQGSSPSVPRSHAGAASRAAESPEAEQFYRHGANEDYLPPDPQPSQSQAVPSRRSPPHASTQSIESYVDTQSEGDTEYAIDAAGKIQRDEHGRPVVFRRHVHQPGDSQEFDEDPRSMQYPPGPMPEAPSVPGTSAQAMASFTPTAASAGAELPPSGPEYEGQGYGGWEALQTRHHHPTRLSDVLEEEEERSSRRTQE